MPPKGSTPPGSGNSADVGTDIPADFVPDAPADLLTDGTPELPESWQGADQLDDEPRPRKRAAKTKTRSTSSTTKTRTSKAAASDAPTGDEAADRSDWKQWRIIHVPGFHAYVSHVSDLTPDDLEHEVAPIVAEPFLTADKKKLICFPVAEHEFYPGTGAEFITAVGLDKPFEYDGLSSLPESATLHMVDRSRVREFVIHRKTKEDPETGELVETNHMIVRNKVTVENVGSTHDIAAGRKLKATSDVGMTVLNYRDDAIVRAHITYQDTLKTAGQATWHSATLLVVNTKSINLKPVSEFLRTLAAGTRTVYFVNGLGPVEHEGRWVFVTGTGAFDMTSGEVLDTYALTTDKAAIRQFGVTHGATTEALASGYRDMTRILDTCPARPGVPAVVLGAAAGCGLSAISPEHRVTVYLHGRPGAGKTSLSYLILAMQSPTARGHNNMHATVSMRIARRGATTNNGANMVLQYAGGFLPLVDDFVQLNSTPMDVLTRQGDLNVMIGGEPVKQNWARNGGPEFARSFIPQGSVLINAERPVSLGSEGILRRIIEVETPDVTWGEPGGFDAALMRELDAAAVMDGIHLAWSDLLVWQATHVEACGDILQAAQAETAGWDEVPNARMRDSYAATIAGLRMMQERARVVGVDVAARVDVAVKDLRETAGRQFALIGSARGNFRSTVLAFLREQMVDGRITVVGEPPHVADGPAGSAAREWVDPLVMPTDSGAEGDDGADPDEAPRVAYANPLALTRSRIGMRYVNNTWSVAGRIVGYLKLPKPTGRKSAMGAAGYVWMNPDQVGTLRRLLVAANLIDDSDDKSFRARLIADSVAVAKMDGGPNNGTYRSLRISAEDIWPSDDTEEVN